MEFLEHLRARSESTKRRYAFLAAIVATAIIGVGWTTTLPARYSHLSDGLENGSETTSGFSDLLKDAGSQLGNVSESIENIDQEEQGTTDDAYLRALSAPQPVSGTEPQGEQPPAVEQTPQVPAEQQPPAETPTESIPPPTPVPGTPANIILKPSVQPQVPTPAPVENP